MQKTLKEKDTSGKTEIQEPGKLILFNSTHTWDDVIIQLEKATGYDLLPCEQIALIAHTKGKATVKTGERSELRTIENVLKEISLITVIE